MRGRTPKARQSEPLTLLKEKIETTLKTLANHCEEEPDAGERIHSSPQSSVLPFPPPRRAEWKRIAGLLAI